MSLHALHALHASHAPKRALFLRGPSSSPALHRILADLSALAPDSVSLSRPNALYPFDDPASLEFLAHKNHAALVVVASSSRKRGDVLIFARLFDGALLDMLELCLSDAHPMHLFSAKSPCGLRPLLLFAGAPFDVSPPHRLCSSLFLDLFGGPLPRIHADGLQHAVCLTATDSHAHLRVYTLCRGATGVSLCEAGPRLDFTLGRVREASAAQLHAATAPAAVPRPPRNTSLSSRGDRIGRVHVAQRLSLQTRKFRALRARRTGG